MHIDGLAGTDPGAANMHIDNLAGTDPGNANMHIYDPSNANMHIDTLDGANMHIADLDNANMHIDDIDAANMHIDALSNANMHIDGASDANMHIDGLSNANMHIDNLGDGSPVSDLTHWVRNEGNTTVGYDVRVVGEQPVDENGNPIPLQLMVTKVYTTPTAFNCQLRQRVHTQVEVNVPNVTPAIQPPSTPIPVTDLDPRATHATMVLSPGQVAQITLRGQVSLSRMAKIGERLGIVSLPQGDPVSIVSDPASCPSTGCTIGGVVAQRRATVTDLFMIVGRGLAAPVYDVADLNAKPTGLVTFVLDDGKSQHQLAVMSIDAGAPLLNLNLLVPWGWSNGVLPPGSSVIAYYAGDAVYAPSEKRWPAAAPFSKRFYQWSGGQGSAVAAAADGSVYAGGVQKLSAAGSVLWDVALTQPSSMRVAKDFVVGSSGAVYVFGESGIWQPGVTTLWVAKVDPATGNTGSIGNPWWDIGLTSSTGPVVGTARAIAVDEAHDCSGTANPQGCIWLVGTDATSGTAVPTLFSMPADGSSSVPAARTIANLAADSTVTPGLKPPLESIGAADDLTLDGSGNVWLAVPGTTLLTAGNLNYVAIIGYGPSAGYAVQTKISLNNRATAVGITLASGRIFVGGTTSVGDGFLAALNYNSFQLLWSSVGVSQLPALTRVNASTGLLAAAGQDATGAGVVLGVDPANGTVRWTSSLGNTITASDVAIGPDGSVFATGTSAANGGFVAKLDPATGVEFGK
jgi:hypothetical protein